MPSDKRKPSSLGTLFFHLCAFFTVAIWGASFVSSNELLLNGLSAVEIYIYRFALAYILIWPFCARRIWANSLKDEMLLMVCGLCGGSIYFIAENTALTHTLVSNVSLITTLAPLFTTMLIGFLYKSERPGLWIYLGSLLSLMGVGFIVFKNGFNMEVAPLGDILALSAAFSWGVYSIVLRKIDANYSALFITRKTFFYGLVTALPFMAMEPVIAPVSTLMKTSVWSNLLFLGLGASLLGYFIWSLTVKRLGAIKASNYLYLQPIVTMILSALLPQNNDPLTITGCLGCALIIGGIWIGDFMSRRKA